MNHNAIVPDHSSTWLIAKVQYYRKMNCPPKSNAFPRQKLNQKLENCNIVKCNISYCKLSKCTISCDVYVFYKQMKLYILKRYIYFPVAQFGLMQFHTTYIYAYSMTNVKHLLWTITHFSRTKWPPFHSQHLQMHFLWWKTFTEVCF